MNQQIIYNAAQLREKKQPKARLSQVNILIMDADTEMATVLRNVLGSLGFGAIYHARNGDVGLKMLREKDIDLVITDWDMEPMDGIQFINHIRTSPQSPNKTLPIIMLTGKANREHVEMARDTGITEFVVKPFTVQTLCNRIILVVEHPRNFILSQGYNGPDRRRRRQTTDSVGERRTELGKHNLIAENDGTRVHRIQDQDIVLINADKTLKEKIGADITMQEIFSEESIKEAQEIIFQSKDEFLSWIADDLKMCENAFAAIAEDPAHTLKDIRMLQGCVLSIKARAGTFGYHLASTVADLLLNVIKGYDMLPPATIRAVRKHLDVLYIIFQRNMEGAGGEIGKELVENLIELGKKLSS